MTIDQRRAQYLAKAKEADEQAAKAKDANVRDTWERIAASYRELASYQSRD